MRTPLFVDGFLWIVASPECSHRIVKAVEKLGGADNPGQEMPVQICFQRRRYACESQHDAALNQVFAELLHDPGGGVIHIRDRFSVNDQPSHR